MARGFAAREMATAIRLAVASSSLTELAETALKPLAHAFGASSILLYRETTTGMEGYVPSEMPNGLAAYAERIDRCPLRPLKRKLNPRVAVLTDMLDSYRASEMFNDVLHPFGFDHQLIARLNDVPFDRVGVWGLLLIRSDRERAWTRTDEDDLRRLQPLVGAAVERNLRFDRLRGERDLLAGELDRTSSLPTLLFGDDGKLVWMSQRAASLLARHLGRRDALTEPFEAAVLGLLALHASPDLPRRLALEVRAKRPGSSLRASLSRAPALDGDHKYVTVTLEDKAADLEVPASLADKFHLTRSELAVTRSLVTGASTQAIADALAISPGTVRSHLKHVYEKMNVHSRVELLVKVRSQASH